MYIELSTLKKKNPNATTNTMNMFWFLSENDNVNHNYIIIYLSSKVHFHRINALNTLLAR